MAMSKPVYLVGAGHAHPERVLSSAELEATIPSLSEGWSEKHLGMAGRRTLPIEGRVGDLLVDAVGDALGDVGWDGASLDAIVCGTAFPDQVVPAAASYVAQAYNTEAVAFDVNAACAGFVYALSIAAALFQTGTCRRAVACAGEHATAYADYTDAHSSVFWGDSGGAALLAGEPHAGGCFEIVDFVLNGDHEYPDKVFVPRGGYFRSDARYSYSQVVSLSSRAVQELYDRNGIASTDIHAAVLHQANQNILQDVGEAIGVPYDRQWHNFEWAGNQSAAGVSTAFSAGWKQHRHELRDGHHVVLAAVGGGYAGSAALLRWTA